MTAFRILRIAGSAATPMQGHLAYQGAPRFHVQDNNADARARLARWHLYAGCDRAPAGWEGRA